jgi:hypothetical protein
MRKRAAKAAEQHLGRLVVLLVGVGVIVAAYFQARTALAAQSLWAGTFLVLVGGLIPWLRKASVSPSEGLALETRPEGAATAEMAERSRETGKPAAEGEELELGDDPRPAARFMVASAAVDQLFHPVEGPLTGCEFRLFLYDSDQDRLLPAVEPRPGPDGSEGWAVGQGVTGAAWRQAEYVFATGKECWDATFGLSTGQQQRYRDLAAVAAMPVTNHGGDLIAVLSGSSTDPATTLVTPQGLEAHLALAACASRILIDLLKWAADG